MESALYKVQAEKTQVEEGESNCVFVFVFVD